MNRLYYLVRKLFSDFFTFDLTITKLFQVAIFVIIPTIISAVWEYWFLELELQQVFILRLVNFISGMFLGLLFIKWRNLLVSKIRLLWLADSLAYSSFQVITYIGIFCLLFSPKLNLLLIQSLIIGVISFVAGPWIGKSFDYVDQKIKVQDKS